MQYLVKYKLFFHTFNKTVEEKLEIANVTEFFDREMNRFVYSEKDACDYVRNTHKVGDIKQLFKIPQEIYDSEYGKVGATSLKILRCWIG